MEQITSVSGKALYDKLSTTRKPYIDRARRGAELTVPALFPAEGTSGSTDFVEPVQSLGARGLRHIAAKLANSLFPVNQPFYRYSVDDLALDQLTEQDDMRGEIEKALSARERAVMNEFDAALMRPLVFEAMRQLVLSGNYLIYAPKEGKPRGYRLTSYVVNRDAAGTLLDIVIKESISRADLPEEVASQASIDKNDNETRDKDLDIYIHVQLRDGEYLVAQEVNGVKIEGEYEGSYTPENLPWIPIRFSYVEGEDYGRGLVEEFIGDLNALEELTKALKEGTVQGAKVVWFVSPNSTINARKLASTKNGDVIQGDAQYVQPLRLDKQADFAVAERYIQKVSERIAYGFMLNSAIQRQGERVTAEEIRYMARELDEGLGGVYSLMSEEFQAPIVPLFERRMEAKRGVPPLPEGVTSMSIVTGMEALGRGNDLQNLDALIAGAANVVGPEAVARYLNVGEYFKRRGASLAIDMGGLIRTEEEIAQSEQQAQLAQLAQNIGPQAIAQAGGLAKETMKGGAAPAPAQGE